MLKTNSNAVGPQSLRTRVLTHIASSCRDEPTHVAFQTVSNYKQ